MQTQIYEDLIKHLLQNLAVLGARQSILLDLFAFNEFKC